MYEKMKSARNIGTLQVKNRVVMTSLGLELAAENGGVSEELIRFYEARAKGGVGLIITGITRVKDGAGAGEMRQLAARGWQDIEGLRKLADAIHQQGTKIVVQLHHPGNQLTVLMNTKPEAPSPVCGNEDMLMPHELSEAECENLVMDFVRGARVAQLAGMDGVELHAAHFYLINEFLTPIYNKRTDKYGGNFEKRMTFLLQIIEGIHEKCGENFPVIVRIMADEFTEGGNTLAEGIAIAKALEKAGVHAIDVSCGGRLCIEPASYGPGSKKELALAIKNAVNIPIIAVNNIKMPQEAEELLQKNVSDFIGMGRGLIADSDWVKKAFEGRENEIVRCISCFRCYNEIYQMQRVVCTVNPDI